MENSYRNLFRGIIFLLIMVLVLLILSISCTSCRTIEVTKEVPVVTEHTTVQHHTDIVRDTLMMRDSIYHYVQGDTVIIERWHHMVNVNKVVVADTIRDTIPKIVTVTKTETKEVNKIHWWQKLLMLIGTATLLYGGFTLYNYIKRR